MHLARVSTDFGVVLGNNSSVYFPVFIPPNFFLRIIKQFTVHFLNVNYELLASPFRFEIYLNVSENKFYLEALPIGVLDGFHSH